MKAICVKLSDAEREVLEELADLAHAKSLSAYVCFLIRQEASRARLSDRLREKLAGGCFGRRTRRRVR